MSTTQLDLPTELAGRPTEPTDPGDPGRGRIRALAARAVLSWPALLAAAAAGIVIVGLSYRLSAGGAPPAGYYATFWAGMLLAVLPLAVRIGRRAGAAADRAWGVALLGLLTAVPKYLRNPTAPSYHDEYAHWREAVDVVATGKLFRPNSLIPIIEYFPGTSALTVGVERLTGLSLWSAGELVLLVTHVLALFAVFVLVEVHLRSARAGAVAALIYALNPSAMYFDTQYAYEGIAVALFLWVIALTSLAARAQGRRRAGLTVAALTCAGGSIVTHHLTTLFLMLTLIAVTVTVTVRARRARRRPQPRPRTSTGVGVWWTVLGVTTLMTAAWLLLVAWATVSYLEPYLGGSLDQLSSMAARKNTGRVLLAPSVQPLWERGLTAASPVVAGLVSLRAVLILRREHRKWRADTLALMACGLVYFPSVLFLLAPSGAEGARRSWAFTYLGLALIGAFVLQRAGEGPRARWHTPVAVAALVVVLVGNVGGGLNDPYRFPGPFRWGTDTNSASAEARTVAQQLAAQAGPVRVVTDRYTALALIAYGGLDVAAPSTGFPAGDLVQSGADPSRELAGNLVGSGFDYLVVDTRMTEQAAFNGDNFGSSDSRPGLATPPANLDRLDQVPWASRIMSTEHLRVYRLDLRALGQPLGGGS